MVEAEDEEAFYADESAVESDVPHASKVAAHLRQRRRARDKKNIAKAAPRHRRMPQRSLNISEATTSGDAERLSQVMDMLSRLPQQSIYVRHKRQVCEKAVSLLQRKKRSSAQAQELAGLLAQLDIWRAAGPGEDATADAAGTSQPQEGCGSLRACFDLMKALEESEMIQRMGRHSTHYEYPMND